MTTTAIAIPPQLQNDLLSKIGDLAMLPGVANEALQLARDPDCEIEAFANVVQKDVTLATEMLSLSNSPVFSGGMRITNLRQAVLQLGFRQCRNLIIASSAASLVKSLPLEQESIREALWKHSMMSATTCGYLNRKFRMGFMGEEYTAGLLHDFGRLLLSLVDTDRFLQCDPLDFKESGDILAAERAVFETDHAEFGAWFAVQQDLPEPLCESIRLHHASELEGPLAELIAVVQAGDHLANHFQRGAAPETYLFHDNLGLQALKAGRFPSIVDDVAQILGDMANEVRAECG